MDSRSTDVELNNTGKDTDMEHTGPDTEMKRAVKNAEKEHTVKNTDMDHAVPIIEMNHVTKIYQLYNHPMDRLKEGLSLTHRSYHRDHTVLEDFNLAIQRGESVGFIGRNGAGKSTLLKLITGVLSPNSGTIETRGKVAALLELGAGFNMEYTGRQNIYLNGKMMGYSRAQMQNRVDPIIEFADIGEFIDQPVKTYSSGMFARLAFAVSINVSPDILIVDEVLSVGDTRFQMKCIDKMKELKESGTTILFVSHTLEQIKRFCSRAVWMKDGHIEMDGDASEVIDVYDSYMRTGLDVKELQALRAGEQEDDDASNESRAEGQPAGADSSSAQPENGVSRDADQDKDRGHGLTDGGSDSGHGLTDDGSDSGHGLTDDGSDSGHGPTDDGSDHGGHGSKDDESDRGGKTVPVDPDMVVSIDRVRLNNTNLHTFDPLEVRISYTVNTDRVEGFSFGVAIYSADRSQYIFGPNTFLEKADVPCTRGSHVVTYRIPRIPLIQGIFCVDVGIFSNGGLVNLDYKTNVRKFVVSNPYFSEGTCYMEHEWKVEA